MYTLRKIRKPQMLYYVCMNIYRENFTHTDWYTEKSFNHLRGGKYLTIDNKTITFRWIFNIRVNF